LAIFPQTILQVAVALFQVKPATQEHELALAVPAVLLMPEQLR
jgi:hypothetical protein